MKKKPRPWRFLCAIACMFIFLQANAQEVDVSGTITDELGEPVVGANVVIEGTTLGTVTDINGRYTITVPDNEAILIFSFIGYESRKVKVAGQTVINVVLLEATTELDDVVVIGYGVQRKSDLTGAIASVSKEKLVEMPANSLDQVLQGRAAGVSVTPVTGMPGGGVSIQIRGISSINGTEPLVIVDGIRASLNDLNPGDIESVEILKDASSAAIYGATGGNGVILVTTKKGKTGKLTTNFNSYVGMQKAWKSMDIMNAQEYAEAMNIINALRGRPAFTTQPDTLENYDWQDIMFRDAVMQNYDLSVSGGNEVSTYFVSTNYQKQQGILRNSDYERINFRISSDHKLSKLFKVGENVQFTKAKHIGKDEWVYNNEYNTPILEILRMVPYVPPYDENGNWSVNPTGGGNPKVEEDVTDRTRNNYSVGGNAYVDFTPFKGFVYTSKINAYTNFTVFDEFEKIYHYSPQIYNEHSTVTKSIGQQWGWEWQNYFNYNRNLFDNHNIGIMGGIEAHRTKFSDISGSRQDLINESEEMRYLDAGTNDTLTTLQYVYGTGWEDKEWALFGRLNYDFKGILLLTANYRRDVSSRFGPQFRVGNFPSVSLGWKFSELAFIRNLGIISFGKLRAGYGSTGANAPERYRYYTTINQTIPAFGYIFDHSSNVSTGAALAQMPNREMHWESMKMTNFGLDLGLLNNRLNITIDLFRKSNDGMLIYQSLPAIAGMYQNPNYIVQLGGDARPISNIGEIRNDGLEFTIGFRNSAGALRYSFDFNGTFVRNKVINLEGDSLYRGTVGVNLANICLTSEGMPISQFNGFKTDGIFTWDDAAYNAKGVVYIWNQPFTVDEDGDTTWAQSRAKPGDLRFVDVNGDGVVNNNDKDNIGSPIPKFIFGFSTNLNYKNFDLTLFFEGKFGHKIFNGSKANLMNQETGPNSLNLVLDQYRDPIYDSENNLLFEGHTDTDLPRLDPKGENQNLVRVSDFFIESGNYVRMKNIQLGYTIPFNLSQKAGVERLRIYIGAKNLLTLTKYSGFDPELATSSLLEQGIDKSAVYPQSRILLAGINLSF
jgi:TonB-linked SusC/RagA family outer membrane protein